MPSGRFLLRIEPQVHAALRAAAAAAGLSLNEYCSRRLIAPDGPVLQPAVSVVRRAAEVVGAGLVGVVVFGSWVRGDAMVESDIDVLVVVDATVRLDRSLYRKWDEAPVEWESRRVEPHFARLPDLEGRVSSLWAEAAVEGVVLHERGLEVSRPLIEIRQRIAAGKLVRRWSHGQPYWVEAA